MRAFSRTHICLFYLSAYFGKIVKYIVINSELIVFFSFQDLLVGAPTYSLMIEEGAVFVYINNRRVRETIS